MRIKAHEIDTQARKIVPIALPRQWEFRDVTGRDYGIDMELEIFDKSSSTGQELLFQIKGTEKEIVLEMESQALTYQQKHFYILNNSLLRSYLLFVQ